MVYVTGVEKSNQIIPGLGDIENILAMSYISYTVLAMPMSLYKDYYENNVGNNCQLLHIFLVCFSVLLL